MAFTVVPLHNLNLGAGARVPFSAGFVLHNVPQWLRDDSLLKSVSYIDRENISETMHALVAEYDVNVIGASEPSWTGKEPRSIQAAKDEAAIFANLALWLAFPTKVCFTNVYHATSWDVAGFSEKQHVVQQIVPHDRLLCHPQDV